ncbi:MAG: M61 family metallopeptidase [Gammaproteobacteria bacterium]|nr:M61 family metallopeptidase [Gammaproteobacteria bacterium]
MSDVQPLAAEAAVEYHLRLHHPGARLLEVFCRIRRPDPSGQVLSLPVWIPGSYLIREFSRHIVAIEATSGGEPVALRKLDKASWVASPVEGELLVRAEIYANDLSVRGAHFDTAGAFVNGSSVFLRVQGREREPCVVHLSPGSAEGMSGWQVATSMRRLTGTTWDFGAFAAADYEELIDHPLLIGDLTIAEFEAEGTPHAVVIAGRHEADLGRLTADLARICGWQIGLFGAPAPMARYLFLVRLTGEGFGGLEHRASTALVCHRNDLPRAGLQGLPREYRNFLGLASHEYFHVWNVKRIRPAEFSPYELGRETYTRQLWIFEGITSYYDDLALARSGIVSSETYLELLGRTLTLVYRTPGRRRQTLEDASFDAWIKYYRTDENTPNALVSYYSKGAMVALALDLEVRLRTEGRVTLDDIMRTLWASYGKELRGLSDGAFEELAAEVTGSDLAEFFRNHVRGTVDPPVGILLAQFGVRLQLRAAESATDAGGNAGTRQNRPRPWLGLRTRQVQGRTRVTHVLEGSPAQAAGLYADDEIVALNGLRADGEAWDGLLDRLVIGQDVAVHLLRRDELREIRLAAVEPPRDTVYLAFDKTASPAAIARCSAWLPGAGG